MGEGRGNGEADVARLQEANQDAIRGRKRATKGRHKEIKDQLTNRLPLWATILTYHFDGRLRVAAG